MFKIMALSETQIIDSLRKNAGFVAVTARSLGVTYQAIANRLYKSEMLAAALESIRESHLDLAESQLLIKIKEGELSAITFYLDRIGKHRGYVKREEQSGPDGGPIQMQNVPLNLGKLTDDEMDMVIALSEKMNAKAKK